MKKILLSACFLCIGLLLYATSDTTSVATIATKITNAANGDTLFLKAGTYATALAFPSGKAVVLKKWPSAVSMPVLTANITGAVYPANSGITFDSIDIQYNGQYFFRPSAGSATDKIIFRNCNISLITRDLVNATGDATSTINSIIVDNCIVKNFGGGSYAFIYVRSILYNLTIKNCTFYNFNSESFYYGQSNAQTHTFVYDVHNNTLYKFGIESSATSVFTFCRLDVTYGTASTFNFSNNIIDYYYSQNLTPTYPRKSFVIPASSGTVTCKNNLFQNYPNYKEAPVAGWDTAQLYSDATNYFADIANNNFTLPGNFSYKGTDGKTIGDPRWISASSVSNDATLTALAVAGNTLTPAFDAATLTYNVSLPIGTTLGTLPAVTYTPAANAAAVKTNAAALPGATTIVVTAQDGTTKKTYTINFTVTAASTDATLTALSVAGNTLSPAFASGTTAYSIVLPYGTTIGNLPVVTYTAVANATVTKTDAAALPGTTIIHVVAQDGTTSKDYTINFTVTAASTDATLTALSVAGNTLSPAFSAVTLAYSVTLPAGTTVGTLPAVTYTMATNATVIKTNAAVLPGATTIVVTAQDGSTKKTYTINFTVLGTGVQTLAANGLEIGVNANTVELESTSNILSVKVLNINGVLMSEKKIGSTKATVDTNGWSTGVYVFTIQTQAGATSRKIGIVK